ncbi:bifunctional 5,10-methylenetetrahydrofolate dehydrogenase/5,10-methenyltetrahydrofolate cyclohydrolase [Clostridium manihotivorum]|jgi:methylenetetrahydrofolate dehydrogenase (NADP+)/methenyltetrahydrofolate cyclohydrolase|uniref:Bifunctional protein FolD n=1 Tax=Clostridium manihotivorum TaxID=2320868 RepID=A0A3R5QY01_9CLOT|nr:tetrahydrofolate dehydrogenase/cyclohydrolase catalytic domain-containing protein [Clostridium manihotivorum]QAA32068.1 bifunctional methylenetetrahydrofolate dehydrogenase/methenyltetrahydrofolate cyclohydrolase [Clostridium manihotivorum]
MGEIIDGKKVAASIKDHIREFVNSRIKDGKSVPTVASVLIGEDDGSIYYQNSQSKIAADLGINYKKINLSSSCSEEEAIKVISELNADNSVNGIILLLPLPEGFDEKKIISSISPSKDIDCLTDVSIGKFYSGNDGFIPCTPRSVMKLLEYYNIEISGKRAVVVGRSNVVGKPVAQLLLQKNATVTICHSRTSNLQEICKEADILVVAMGKPHFIDKSYIKKDATVIDVGTSSLNGKITGDVLFNEVVDVAAMTTPVPGGVGALTTTLLFLNVCEAMEEYDSKDSFSNRS